MNYTLNESCVIDFQLTRVQWIDIFYGNTSLNSRVSRSSTNMRVNLCSFNPSCNSMVKDNLTLLFRDPNGENHSQLIPLSKLIIMQHEYNHLLHFYHLFLHADSTECCCTSGGQILSPLKAVFLTCLLAVSILWLF